MVFVTFEEYNGTKLYALENRIYRRIERVFTKAFGYAVAEKMLAKFSGKTLRELSQNSFVDVMSAITVLV